MLGSRRLPIASLKFVGAAALVAVAASGWVALAERVRLGHDAQPRAARTLEPDAGPLTTRSTPSDQDLLRPLTPGERPGTKLIGDIMTFDPECPKAQEFARQNGITLNSAYVGSSWPGGIVPYIFDANVNPSNRNAMRLAMDEWELVANVTFVERTSESYYLRIFDGTGNWSYVGRLPISYQPQDVSIYNWGWRFIMAHELAHAMGFLHEQSRPDRNSYVEILTNNIQNGAGPNFVIDPNAQTLGQNYNYESIMHYGRTAFSTNGQDTIRTLDPSKQNTIGNRSYLSVGDAAMMAHVYGSPSGGPMLSLSDPNGGEIWAIGTSYDLTWESSGAVGGTVDIELSTNGGEDWTLIFDDTANDGAETWLATGPATTQALLRITDASAPEVSDESDAVFELRSGVLQLLAPNGFEVLDIGGDSTITWSTWGNTSGFVDILISRDGGQQWNPLLLSTPNDGEQIWTSIAGPSTTQARLRVRDTAEPSTFDDSNANFTLRVPPVVLTSRVLVQKLKVSRRGDGRDAVALSGYFNMPPDGLALRNGVTTISLGVENVEGSGWSVVVPENTFSRRGSRWSFRSSDGAVRVDVDTTRGTFRVQAKNQNLSLPTSGDLSCTIAFPTLVGAQVLDGTDGFQLGRSELRDVFFVTSADIVRKGGPQGDSVRLAGWFRPSLGHDAPSNLEVGVDLGTSWSEELVSGSLQPSGGGSTFSFQRRLRQGLSSFVIDSQTGRFSLRIDAVNLGTLSNDVELEIRLGEELIGRGVFAMIGDPTSKLSLR